MSTYDTKDMTWGYELEVSDVPRSRVLAPHFGQWEHSERDIVNMVPPYRGIAADPLGEIPPVGGEINTVPSRRWQHQVQLIAEFVSQLRAEFIPVGCGPTSHGHVHVHVPGLIGDIDALKRLTTYVFNNQKDMVEICGGYWELPREEKKARAYFKHDGGRMLPAYIVGNILSRARDFDEFIKMHAAGKDGVSMGRPFRYAINMYSLKHTKTVEFRMFRGTLDEQYLANSFKAVERFMWAALNDGPPIHTMIQDLPFAPMWWDKELWDGLQATKHGEKRGKKVRAYQEVK